MRTWLTGLAVLVGVSGSCLVSPAQRADAVPAVDVNEIAYVTSNQTEIGFIDADGSNQRTVQPQMPNNESGLIESVDISPTGGKVLFDFVKSGAPCGQQLYTMDPDGSGAAIVSTAPALCQGEAVWSPDGTRIAFDALTAPGSVTYAVYTAPAAGGTPTELAPGQRPSWSPDGKSIAFVDPKFDVAVAPSQGGAVQDIHNPWDGQVDQPRWSPDGKWIAFSGQASPDFPVPVVRMTPQGGDAQQLFSVPLGVSFNWTPDSHRLLLARAYPNNQLQITGMTGRVDARLNVEADKFSWIRTSPNNAPGGYRLAGAGGGVFTFGNATFHGSAANAHLARPVVGLADTASGNGYWLAGADGGIFNFGDATFHGSLGNVHLNAPIVAIAPTPTGNGYWLAGADGGIFNFGDATFHGSLGNVHLNAPIVAIAPTPTGNGYWLVGADGGIFNFGDATFHGSLGNVHLNAPIVAIAPTPTGNGYWLVGADGGVFNFGDATFHASAVGSINAPIVGILPRSGGTGYLLAGSDGSVYVLGNTSFNGQVDSAALAGPIVAIGN